MKLLALARVIVRRNARAASVAMHVLVFAFDPTHSALVAMVIISLGPVVKEVARRAKVGGKCDATCFIVACLAHRLPHVALIAHYFFDRVSVHFMCLGIVVAVPTHVRLIATRGHKAASSDIMFAIRHFRLFEICCVIVVLVF
jgi:hypothetical protein